MSEKTIRCRMKFGEAEFEIEGVANKALEDKIEYLYKVFKETIEKTPRSSILEKQKPARRAGGGRKPAFYKNNIQRIMDEEPEWLVDKDAAEISDKLKTQYGVPGANEDQVEVTLIRLFRKGLLTRKHIKEKGEKGKYLYSIVSLKKP